MYCDALQLYCNQMQYDAAQYDPLGCTIAIDTCGRPRNSCPQCVTDRRNCFQHIVVRFNMANGMWPSSVFFDLSNSLCGMKTLERVFFTLRFHLEMFKYLIKIEECLWDDIFRHQWQYPTKYMESINQSFIPARHCTYGWRGCFKLILVSNWRNMLTEAVIFCTSVDYFQVFFLG